MSFKDRRDNFRRQITIEDQEFISFLLDSPDIIADFMKNWGIPELDYYDKLAQNRRDEIHYDLVKKHLNSIMKNNNGTNKAGGSYDELQEGIKLQDGQRLTEENIKRYATENGIQLRTKADIFSESLNECISNHIEAQRGRF